jgi:hypothetical protein
MNEPQRSVVEKLLAQDWDPDSDRELTNPAPAMPP